MRGAVASGVVIAVLAATAATAAPCDSATSTVEINQCFERELARADTQLNEA